MAVADGSGEKRKGGVQSVLRALRLLEMLGEDAEGYRLTDLAGRSGLSPSTVHRLLTTLEERHFVQFDPTDGMWHVGRQAFAVGASFVTQRNFVAPALPFLKRLRDITHETANLGIAEAGEMVVLTQVESRAIMRAITRVGGRVPMVASGMGKAILSTYQPEQVAAIVARFGMRRLTPATITRASVLKRQLAEIRRCGYAVDDEEYVQGLRCVAAVVRNQMGEALCAISVSGLAVRLPRERIAQIGDLVSETAQALTAALGGQGPSESLAGPVDDAS